MPIPRVSRIFGAVTALLTISVVSCAAQESTEAWQKVDDQRRFSTSEDARYEEKGESVELKQGALMLENLDNSAVLTPLSVVEPKKHSLVFARSGQGCEHIFVMLGDAEVLVGQHKTNLKAGDEIIVADHDPSAVELLGGDFIGRRRLRLVKLPNGRSVGVGEFSLVQAIEREPVLYRLVHSHDAHDKLLKERLIKTAAILNYVTARHGQYQTGAR